MTFQQLQYLLEVNRAGSISQAAKNLFISASSVSVSISNLETELGYPIFVRKQQGLVPTARGEKVLEYARRIFDAYRSMTRIVPTNQAAVRIDSTDNNVINRAFCRLVAESPKEAHHNFSIYSRPLNEAISMMLTNDLDISLTFRFSGRARTLKNKLEKNGLQWQVLATVPGAVRLSVNHRYAHRTLLKPNELETELMVDTPVQRVSKSYFLKGIMNVDQERVITTDSLHARRELIAMGIAYDFIPNLPQINENPNEICYVPVDGVSYELITFSNPRYTQKPEITRFLELLEEELTRQAPPQR